MAKATDFFTKEEEQSIVSAIKVAENNTSGEIRVHIENHSKKDALDRAAEVFHNLKMDATELRNGVLFYIAVKDHHFSIIGDKGINDVVPTNFWNEIKDHMQTHFKEKRFATGLSEGIQMAGQALKEHFPHAGDDDINELPDDISTSNQ